MKSSITILTSISLLALTACNSSNNGTITGPPDPGDPTRTFADETGDAGQALADGETLTARPRTTAGITLDYDNNRAGETALVANPDLAIELNENGELTLTIEGQEQAFSMDDYYVEDDGRIFGYFNEEKCDNDDICNNLFSWSGTLEEFKATGNGYHKVYLAQTNQLYGDGALNLRAFGVAGTETRDDGFDGLGTASYSGRSRIDAYPTTGFVDNGTSRLRIESDVAMTADFGAGTISGVMDEFRTRDPGSDTWEDVDGTVAMQETALTGNAFDGTLAADAVWQADTGATFTGSYAGAFYGPAAEEAAGSISVTATDDDLGDLNGIGFFSTSKNE